MRQCALGIFAVTSDQAPSPLDLFRICDVGFGVMRFLSQWVSYSAVALFRIGPISLKDSSASANALRLCSIIR